MPKLMNEDVVRETIIGGYGAVDVENSATAISSIVGEYLNEFIRSKLGDFAQRVIIEGEHITFGTKGVVSCAQRRVAIDAGRRPRDAALSSGRAKRPHIEIFPVFFEGRGCEQNVCQPAGVRFKLVRLSRRV